MKVLLKIWLIFSLLFSANNTNISFAEESKNTTYAKALSGCKMYKTKEMENDFSEVLFIVPETYFVIVLETVNDDCFKVQYDRFIGYVDSSTVIIASFIPIVKTLDNITFDIKSTAGTQLWSEPTTRSNVCTTIGAGTKNIKYIAYVYGSVPSDGESNIWYYVYYTPNENSTNVYEGYIYSENTTNLSEIVANTESNPEVILDNENSDNLIFISSTIKTIVIAIIVVPIILFFAIILYKLVQKIKKNTNNSKVQILKSDEIDAKNEHSKKLNFFEKYKSMKLLKPHSNNKNFSEIDDDELL